MASRFLGLLSDLASHSFRSSNTKGAGFFAMDIIEATVCFGVVYTAFLAFSFGHTMHSNLAGQHPLSSVEKFCLGDSHRS